MSSLYVFAFTSESAPPVRHGGRRIEFIDLDGIHAAVEHMAARPAASEQELRVQHEIVMRIADAVEAIVPARFGALVDKAELEQLVSMRRASLLETLRHVSRRVQMTVRVYAPYDRGAPEYQPLGSPKSGTEYLAERQREAGALTGEAATLSAALRDLIQDERRHRGQGRIEWTLYHLVERTAVGPYRRATDRFSSASLSVTGPWPPFAFVPDLWP
jgi:hypothetical protein